MIASKYIRAVFDIQDLTPANVNYPLDLLEIMEVRVNEDSCYEAIDAVNKLLKEHGLKVEFVEGDYDGYEVITIVKTKDDKCPDWDE